MIASPQPALSAEDYLRLEGFRRNGAGQWVLDYYTPANGDMQLVSLEFTTAFADLYEDVILAPLITSQRFRSLDQANLFSILHGQAQQAINTYEP